MDLDAKIAQLKKGYLEQLPQKLSAIVDAWRQVTEQDTDEARFSLYRLVHSLAGSGATYGFPALSESARAVEDLVKADDASSKSPLPHGDLERTIGDLERVAKEIVARQS